MTSESPTILSGFVLIGEVDPADSARLQSPTCRMRQPMSLGITSASDRAPPFVDVTTGCSLAWAGKEQLVIGQVLGHCRVLAKIGEGGMCLVYRAYDEVLHR